MTNADLIAIIQSNILTDLNHWIEMQLSGTQNNLFSFFVVFLGGLTASLLPCVYPLYPITAGIISRRAKNSRILHPLAYYIGLAFMYFLFGLVAAVSGGAFNQVMRFPLTNILIAGLIFILGLASIELLYIPLFHQHDFGEGQHGLKKTFLMGMGAGFLSSPCVGPVVVAILLQITSITAENPSLYLIGLASVKMFIFGLGLGLPFILVSIFHVQLPRSGKWMKWVEYLLGIMIFYFAYGFLEKGLSQAGFKDSEILLTAAGFILLVFAHYFYQPMEKSPQEKTKNSLLLAGMILGVLFLARGIVYPNVPVGSTVSEVQKEVHGNLEWYREKDIAYSQAKKTGKKVFIDFFGEWCTNCKDFEEMTQTDAKLNQALQSAVLLKVYDTDPVFALYAADKRFNELNIGLPFFVILDHDGNVIFKTSDYLQKEEMIRILEN